MYKAIIGTICITLLLAGCGLAPEEINTPQTIPNKPTLQNKANKPVSVNPPTSSLTLPKLTEDIATCAANNLTFCNPNSTPLDYTKCRYREAEQETIADDTITDIYICTHEQLDNPLKLIVTTYTYTTSDQLENALSCKIYANDDVVGFSMCAQKFCVQKIKEYTSNGFNCEKK